MGQCNILDYTYNCSASFTNINCGMCPNGNNHCDQDPSTICGNICARMTITGGSNFCCIDSITVVPQYSTQCWSSCVALVAAPLLFWTLVPGRMHGGNRRFYCGYSIVRGRRIGNPVLRGRRTHAVHIHASFRNSNSELFMHAIAIFLIIR
jgi:hypothetical protein